MTHVNARPTDQPQRNGLSGAEQSTADGPTLEDTCVALRQKIDEFLGEETTDSALQKVQARVRESIAVIEEGLRRYGPEHLSIAYNGGKDCLVMLVLILASVPSFEGSSRSVHAASSNTTASFNTYSGTNGGGGILPCYPTSLKAVYVAADHPFPEVEAFVISSAQEYHLDIHQYKLPMRLAMEAYLAAVPTTSAIFVGTRRADPHGEHLTHFDPTDGGWPDFMRIHPVIDWHYSEIWTFLRRLQIRVCDLYNKGYTSLGSMTDTHPNPALAVAGNKDSFRPAYELQDERQERLGRDR